MEARSDVANRTKFSLMVSRWRCRAGRYSHFGAFQPLVRESSRLRVSPLTANDPRNARENYSHLPQAPAGGQGDSAEQACGHHTCQ
jgi:hypothetical protein